MVAFIHDSFREVFYNMWIVARPGPEFIRCIRFISTSIAHDLSYALIFYFCTYFIFAVILAIRRKPLVAGPRFFRVVGGFFSEINSGTHINIRFATNVVEDIVER